MYDEIRTIQTRFEKRELLAAFALAGLLARTELSPRQAAEQAVEAAEGLLEVLGNLESEESPDFGLEEANADVAPEDLPY